MACYNFTKRADRDRCRADRQAEIDAVDSGEWPRDIDDFMRWDAMRREDNREKYVKKMCKNEIEYLNGVDARVAAGDPDLQGWEP